MRSALGAAFVFTPLVLFFFYLVKNIGPHNRILSSSLPIKSTSYAYLHLLVPATSANKYLCRLILSATALGYPTPVLINFGDIEDPDPVKQHLPKVAGVLKYLDSLPAKHSQDLVLMVDGYDVLFQLRPEVLIQRYLKVIDDSNSRLIARVSEAVARKNGIYNSILFGPDKVCWPGEQWASRCWAVPTSTLLDDAFGPETDKGPDLEKYRPRWLNSGTVIGPVSDLKRLFKKTKWIIENDKINSTSDQLRFANIWGEQEVVRRILAGEHIPERVQRLRYSLNDDEAEYHISIDHTSALFQTIQGYYQSLDWVSYVNGTPKSITDRLIMDARRLNLHLSDDVLSSPTPFRNLQLNGLRQTASILPPDLEWANFRLGTNLASAQTFTIAHFAGPPTIKGLRDTWWEQFWFFPYARRILGAPTTAIPALESLAAADGRVWSNYESGIRRMVERKPGEAISDDAVRLTWSEMCDNYDDDVFLDKQNR